MRRVCAQKINASLAQAAYGWPAMSSISPPALASACIPDDGEDAEALLRAADMALYRAKDQGRDNYQFFTPDLNVRAVERRAIETGLHNALEKQEFELFYQPKMNLKTGAIVGAEALIRWRHPDRGLSSRHGSSRLPKTAA